MSQLSAQNDTACDLMIKLGLAHIETALDSHNSQIRRLAAFLLSNVIVTKNENMRQAVFE
jgi:hypothetical protein